MTSAKPRNRGARPLFAMQQTTETAMSTERETEPGTLLKGYERLKAKIGGLFRSGGTVPAGQDWKTAGNENTPDAVRSQEEMKTAFGRAEGEGTGGRQENERPIAEAREGAEAKDGPETAIYEDVVPQAARGDREAAEADAQADADSEADRGEIELEGPALRAEDRGAPRAADLPPAARTADAPSLTDLDRRALETLAEDEVGRVPSDGMGLDDTPRDARGEKL